MMLLTEGKYQELTPLLQQLHYVPTQSYCEVKILLHCKPAHRRIVWADAVRVTLNEGTKVP